MGSPQGREESGKENVKNEVMQDLQLPANGGSPSRGNPHLIAPIEMSEIHEQPPASALEDPQWPLNSTVGEANHELQASPSLQSKQAESHSPPPTASPPVPLREPLATSSANAGQSPSSASPHSLTRENTGPAIGPIADKPLTNPQGPDAGGLSLFITLLLTSGARHPFKIDERYFKKRNVSVDGSNPVNMSVYTLKELIWREWRDGKHSAACGGRQQAPWSRR